MALPRRKRSHEIVRKIEEDIRKRRIQPGDRMPSEGALCGKFAASRTVIREVLQQLRAQGMLHTFRGSGSFVSAPDSTEIRKSFALFTARARDAQTFLELMDLRMLIETESSRLLARQQSADALAAVKARLTEMKTLTTDLARFGEADIEFHLEIVRNAGNSLYSDILCALLPEIGVRFAHETYTESALVAKNLRDHIAIYAALVDGNARLAAAAMHHHLSDSRRHLIVLFDLQ